MKERRKLLRSAIDLMPRAARQWVLRKGFKVRYESVPEDLVLKIATTKEELEQAYHILYDSYIEYGYQKPLESQMRILKYFALPTTTTIVAKIKNQVVGTLTIIRRTQLGLPLEKEFDLQKYINTGRTAAEVSSLAIAKEFRHRRGTIFLPICYYLHKYLREFMEVDYAVIAVNPAWVDFYEGLLLFSMMEKKVVGQYDFANGAPAVGLISKTSNWDYRFKMAYGHAPPDKNLFSFFNADHHKYCQWPDRTFHKSMDPVFTPEMLEYFFIQKSSVFKDLTPEEFGIIKTYYIGTKLESIFDKIKIMENRRKRNRCTLNLTGLVDSQQIVRISEVGVEGLKIHGLFDGTHEIKISLSDGIFSILTAQVVWKNNETREVGFKILKSDPAWKEFIQYLYADYEKTG